MTAQDNVRPAVTIIVGDAGMAVMDPPLSLVANDLQYRTRKFEAGGPTGVRELEETVAAHAYDFRDRLGFTVGCLPRVTRLLRDHGYDVRIDDRRERGSRLTADYPVIFEHGPKVLDLLEAVLREPLGQIEVRRPADAVGHCAQIAMLFPEAEVAVVVPTLKTGWWAWREMTRLLDEPVGVALNKTRRHRRVTVGTYTRLLRQDGWDVVLLLDAEAAAAKEASYWLTLLPKRRMYAFVQPQRRRDHVVELTLEVLVGPVIHSLARPRLPVRVVFAPVPATPVARHATALKTKRSLYWYNQPRNQRILELAVAAVKDDRPRLRRLGVRDQDIEEASARGLTSVAVLVEVPEHGRQFQKLLPGALLLDNGPGADHRRRWHDGPALKFVTAAYAATHPIKPDVIVRATGTGWPLRVKGWPPARDDVTTEEVLLVDFMDTCEPQAAQDSRRRLEDYRSRGMHVARVVAGI
jgi:hypothetical protein